MIYGLSEKKQLSKQKILDENCPKCNSVNSLESTVFTGYYYIFGFPLASLGKKGFAQCHVCNKTMRDIQLKSSLRYKVEFAKGKIKVPLYYHGTLIIFGIIFLGLCFNQIKREYFDKKEYIASPKINDVYYYKIKEDSYSLFKIKKIKNDSLYVIYNSFESNSRINLKELDDSSKYDNQHLFPLSKKEIFKMDEESKIIFIER